MNQSQVEENPSEHTGSLFDGQSEEFMQDTETPTDEMAIGIPAKEQLHKSRKQ